MTIDYGSGKVVAPLDVWQRAAVALCEWACGYDQGRSKDDHVYKLVTENRDGPGPEQRKTYSSCCDLGHFMLERLGVRADWINRDDDGVFGAWRPVANVTNLDGKCPIKIMPPKSEWIPEPGDICLIWKPDYSGVHLFVCAGPPVEGRLHTYNYGKGGMSPLPNPGAGYGKDKLTWDGHYWIYGSKRVGCLIRLRDAIQFAAAKPILNEGCSMTGEDMDALEFGVNDAN